VRTRLRPSLAAALIAFGACVPQPFPVRSQHLRYSGCAGVERALIADSFDRAADLTERTLFALRDSANRDLARTGDWLAYRSWFGHYADDRFATIEDVYGATQHEFDLVYAMRCGDRTVNCPPDDVAVEREVENAAEAGPTLEAVWAPGRAWKVFAYSNTGIRSIQFCRDFFNEGARERASIVLHELTHIVRDTEDYAYREVDVLDLAAHDPLRAAHNAPNYAGFAANVVYQTAPGDRISTPEDDD
jgi:hypothetical protein